ncbi:hypothetical protein BG011_001263 [Mortierella polycephala]|uniref:Uncharacterized protein n=1 Tax=Mortierella polycephala TaxID=41804 RepID=A0A9P6Q968_9FUNG|nr:hypothetical protein BG011_001263 [Mortierella polycephala]
MTDVLYSQRATNKLLDSIGGLFHPEPVRQSRVKQRGIAVRLLVIGIVAVADMGFKQTMDKDEKCSSSESAGRTPCLVRYGVVAVELVSGVMMSAEAVLTRLTRKDEARRAAQSLDVLAKEQQQQQQQQPV